MAEEKKEKKTAAKKPAAAKKAPAKKAAPKKEAAVEVKEEVKAAAPAKKAPAKKAAAKEEAKKVEKKAEKKVEKPAVTEAIRTVWNIRTTPRKVRLVCDVVRGKSVAEALGILSRLNKAASLPVAKAIKSAAANAVNNFGMQENLLYVAEIQASDGLRIKRFIPRAKGSASGLVKRNANLRVIVKEAK
ncbi:MAG: 50S ribosomal protein L22 [Candidatus Enteromonas sp.]|nr:50S ribosomal protein L22 [Candidatus Enteromonas sp.]